MSLILNYLDTNSYIILFYNLLLAQKLIEAENTKRTPAKFKHKLIFGTNNKHLHEIQKFTVVTIFMLKHVNQHSMKIINFVSFNAILTFTHI